MKTRSLAWWERGLSAFLAVLMALPLNAPLSLFAVEPVVSYRVNGGDPNRSMVTNIGFTLSTNWMLPPGGFVLRTLPSGVAVASSNLVLRSLGGTNEFSVAFTNLPGGSLPDGSFSAEIVSTPSTNLSGPRVGWNTNLHRLFGDYDGDGDVDFHDTFWFRSTWLESTGSSHFDARFDFDGNGRVETNDLVHFSTNYFTVLPPTPSLLAHLLKDDGVVHGDGKTSDPTIGGRLVKTNDTARLFLTVATVEPPSVSGIPVDVSSDIDSAGRFQLGSNRIAAVRGEPLPFGVPHLARFVLVETNGTISVATSIPFTIESPCTALEPATWLTSATAPPAGKQSGGVQFADCVMTLSEGSSFAVTAERSLQVPFEQPILSITFENPSFDATATNQIRDAFEVAVVDELGRPLTYTVQGGSGIVAATQSQPDAFPVNPDAFFNLTQGQEPAWAPG